MYFHTFLPYDIYDKVIITEKGENYTEGEIRGKKLMLWNLKDIKIGEKLVIMGDFKYSPDYSFGVVGEYKVFKSKSSGFSLLYWSNKILENIKERLKNIVSTEAYGYVNAMALGDRSFLKNDEIDDLKTLGIIHILAVSGLHMVIIYNIVGSVVKK